MTKVIKVAGFIGVAMIAITLAGCGEGIDKIKSSVDDVKSAVNTGKEIVNDGKEMIDTGKELMDKVGGVEGLQEKVQKGNEMMEENKDKVEMLQKGQANVKDMLNK
jgi:methyl-accepting chemotaxis protein